MPKLVKRIVFDIDVMEFVQTIGRKPKNRAEFERYADYVTKGVEAQIDWGMVELCAHEEITKEKV